MATRLATVFSVPRWQVQQAGKTVTSRCDQFGRSCLKDFPLAGPSFLRQRIGAAQHSDVGHTFQRSREQIEDECVAQIEA